MTYEFRKTSTGVLIHADIIEQIALDQINDIEAHPAMKGLIAIMPDVHAGAGCVIGLTGKFGNAVIPNIVGVDIGCGVAMYPLGKEAIDFHKLDDYIRENVPLGFKSRCDGSDFVRFLTEEEAMKVFQFCGHGRFFYREMEPDRKYKDICLQVGTLGGGNHFIEIDEDDKGNKFLTVHTGSRNFGLQVATHFQRKAKKLCEEMGIEIPTGLEYLPMSAGGKEYMEWMKHAQQYANINREVIIRAILEHLKVPYLKDDYMQSVHNYISPRDHIIRKGAISAYPDETVLIPLNMADGIIVGKGKANKRYNYSAPHGAGRVFGRKEMFRKLEAGEFTMKQFESSMEGVFSTSVKEITFDESKFAYKSKKDVMKHIEETVDVQMILKPVYNLKSDDENVSGKRR